MKFDASVDEAKGKVVVELDHDALSGPYASSKTSGNSPIRELSITEFPLVLRSAGFDEDYAVALMNTLARTHHASLYLDDAQAMRFGMKHIH